MLKRYKVKTLPRRNGTARFNSLTLQRFNRVFLFVAALSSLIAALPARAQNFDTMSADQLMQLMLAAPKLAVNQAVNPSASFDPPVISPGGRAVYRVTLHILDEAITRWPARMPAPAGLDFTRGAEGMAFNFGGGLMAPITVINYHATSEKPGVYVIPEYEIEIYGKPVKIPEARLEVSAAAGLPSARQLLLDPAKKTVYVGEAARIRVFNPAGENHVVPMMQQVQLNGEGFIANKGDTRQQITTTRLPDGREATAFIYDTSITPFSRGPLTISAQAFTSGNQFSGTMVIQGQAVIPGGPPEFSLLESDPVTLNVIPVPADGRLPGFNGAIGRFTRDNPRLSATTIQAGDALKLSVTFHSDNAVVHLGMPDAPSAPAWEAFSAGPPQEAGNSVTFTYTMIPQTEMTAATPEIPFSYFDPDLGQYVDLSIPAMPVKVLPGPSESVTNGPDAMAGIEPEKKLSLKPPVPAMGRTTNTLVPLQERGWFLLVQFGPVVAIGLWWLACRRRQYLEQHPDIVRRREARRALRRELRTLRHAAQSGNAPGFSASAVRAIRVACAPHFPAEPRALVCSDILQLLPESERTGETGRMVRRLFVTADAAAFAGTAAETAGMLELRAPVEQLLADLEARL